MRKVVLAVLCVCLVFGGGGEEPTEQQMRRAFSQSLILQVQNALDFMSESAGPEAVARMRTAGHDRFSIDDFRKLQCRPDGRGYVCEFKVGIGLVNGPLHRAMRGRFVTGPEGVSFQEV